jgi:hypothetical protein
MPRKQNDPTKSNRRRFLKGIGATALATATLSSNVLATKSDVISEQLAYEMAKAKVEALAGMDEFSKWERGDVSSPELFQLPTSNGSATTYAPAVYVFPIKNSGNQVGHISISARTQLPPVLGYSTNPAPQLRLEAVTESDVLGALSFGDKFIYLGGMSYGIEAVNPGAASEEKKRYVDLRGNYSTALHSVDSIESFEVSSDAASRQWKAVNNTSPSQHVGSVTTQSRNADEEVSGVPNWTEGDNDDPWAEWDGCSPIAASMAIGHHEGTSYSDRDGLIDVLHQRMSTRDVSGVGDGLTIPGDIPRGIRNYDQGDHNYKSPSNNFTGVGLSRKQQTKNQIGDGNPLLLSTMPVDATLVGHTETVVGYEDGSNFYYKCHDTYGGVNWIRHKNWLTGFTTPVTPE